MACNFGDGSCGRSAAVFWNDGLFDRLYHGTLLFCYGRKSVGRTFASAFAQLALAEPRGQCRCMVLRRLAERCYYSLGRVDIASVLVDDGCGSGFFNAGMCSYGFEKAVGAKRTPGFSRNGTVDRYGF